MVLGLGTDLVRVGRLKAALSRHPRLAERLFTAGEQQACLSSVDPYPHFAARFAAKEAFLKALGTGWAEGIRWTDVEVTGGRQSPPGLSVCGRAAQLLAEKGGEACLVSLSHDGDYAVAVCIIQG